MATVFINSWPDNFTLLLTVILNVVSAWVQKFYVLALFIFLLNWIIPLVSLCAIKWAWQPPSSLPGRFWTQSIRKASSLGITLCYALHHLFRAVIKMIMLLSICLLYVAWPCKWLIDYGAQTKTLPTPRGSREKSSCFWVQCFLLYCCVVNLAEHFRKKKPLRPHHCL